MTDEHLSVNICEIRHGHTGLGSRKHSTDQLTETQWILRTTAQGYISTCAVAHVMIACYEVLYIWKSRLTVVETVAHLLKYCLEVLVL